MSAWFGLGVLDVDLTEGCGAALSAPAAKTASSKFRIINKDRSTLYIWRLAESNGYEVACGDGKNAPPPVLGLLQCLSARRWVSGEPARSDVRIDIPPGCILRPAP